MYNKIMIKKSILILPFLMLSLGAFAQEADSLGTQAPKPKRKATVDVRLETRASYGRDYIEKTANKNGCGFTGDNIDLYLQGTFADEFSWLAKDKLATIHFDQTFFDSFEDLWIKWEHKGWNICAGKQVVQVGGWEYYANPIDIYDYSETIGHWSPFQFGISAGYTLKDQDTFTIQFCQSPVFQLTGLKDTYGYSACWSGRHGIYSAIWSVNFFEQQKGEFLNWVALGNRFTIKGFNLDIDLYHKMGVGDGSKAFDSFGVVGEASVICAKDHLRIFAKGSYNRNESTTADLLVLPGTEITQISGGLEYFPLKGTKDLRIHAFYSYAFGTPNSFATPLRADKESRVGIGVTWKVSLIDLVRKMYRNE